ncbi:MAG: carbohydrate ABC transporter permease [Chloroflexi bacterium]|nr:carbohydrate ABC transporter permease [Chloroflexota bacterium]
MVATRQIARRPGWTSGQVVAFAVLVGATLVSLFPMFWMITTALTPTSATIKMPPSLIPLPAALLQPDGFLPDWLLQRAYAPTLDNFERLVAETQGNVWRWLANSLAITFSTTAFHVAFDSLAGYAFARKTFPGRDVLFWLLLATLMIPPQVTLMPNFLLVKWLGLADSHLGVILPGFADVFGIFLMRQYLQTLPRELEEAARIDGAGEWTLWWRVILPLATPAMATLAIFMFVRGWNNFLWPLVVLRTGANYTLPVGVATLQGEFAADYGLIMAGAVLAALPLIAFFLIFQRYFLDGIRVGALKG